MRHDAKRSDLAENGGLHLTPRYNPTKWRAFYYHPLTQTILLGIIFFLGSWNALNGLGAAGQVDSKASANSNTVFNATLALVAFIAGPIDNVLGYRLALFIGSMGYAISISSYLVVDIYPQASAYVIASGAILGICAALLWTAQGCLMLAYPTEGQKGRYISIFWSIYNTGGVVGAAVNLGSNIKSQANSVGRETYVIFLALSSAAVLVPLIMAKPNRMIRADGTKVSISTQSSWKSELVGFALTIKNDPYILTLFPLFLASNWFYSWQFNAYNGALFNIRARSLNNFIYWGIQIIWSLCAGRLLDQKIFGRRARAFISWAVLFAIIWGTHIWGYLYQRQYTRESILPEVRKMDIYDAGYAPRAIFYALCAILNASIQIWAYWILGAMSNDPQKLAYFTGLHSSVQFTGSAITWRMDAIKAPFMVIFISSWIVLVAGLLFSLPVIYWRLKDQTDIILDLHPTVASSDSEVTELESLTTQDPVLQPAVRDVVVGC